jgi:hypothetical protein
MTFHFLPPPSYKLHSSPCSYHVPYNTHDAYNCHRSSGSSYIKSPLFVPRELTVPGHLQLYCIHTDLGTFESVRRTSAERYCTIFFHEFARRSFKSLLFILQVFNIALKLSYCIRYQWRKVWN